MNYVIDLLESTKKKIDREVKQSNLMGEDMGKATKELSKITEIKKAIKILKIKNKKR